MTFRTVVLAISQAALLLWAGASWAAASYPTAEQAQIAKTGKYVGSDACLECHEDEHKTWAGSRHTQKVTKGPAFGKEFEKNIYGWVKRDWDKLDGYMIVDAKDSKTNYLAARKVPWTEVDYVIGQTYKQRYMKYYDGGPLEVFEAKTEDGGISWKLDKSKVSQFPGNKERAGYKILFLEMNPQDGKMNQSNYGEFRSWQERCIACHTTGFDPKAWDQAKADFVAGRRADLRDIFVADLRVGCESCHGPGDAHVKSKGSKSTIIHPAKITDVAARQMVCGQCHTRTQASKHSPLAQDLRGYRLMDEYTDFATFTRPAWGKGNRQVSIDGKGRRDHQQDMDIRLSAAIRGSHSAHADMACFDCHDAMAVGVKGRKNPTLKKASATETCAACHGAKAATVMKVMDGRQGWQRASFPNWATEFGRQGNKQHVFAIHNVDGNARSWGLSSDRYHWSLKKGGDATKEAEWEAIWPWEKGLHEKQGRIVSIGASPWKAAQQ
jgi:mono/diheme cytochrome c family protein